MRGPGDGGDGGNDGNGRRYGSGIEIEEEGLKMYKKDLTRNERVKGPSHWKSRGWCEHANNQQWYDGFEKEKRVAVDAADADVVKRQYQKIGKEGDHVRPYCHDGRQGKDANCGR